MMRPPVAVRGAVDADRAVTATVLARAFIDDPAMGFLFPETATRPLRLDRFFALMIRLDPGAANWSLALDGEIPVAAAVWRAPGDWNTPMVTMLSHLPQMIGAFGWALPRALAMQAAMERSHPHAPHWYLQFAGCVPEAQGRGFGGAAIRARLAHCDAAGLPAALETATEGNLAIYAALGFVVTGEHRYDKGPDFWTMWRDPR